MRTVVFQSVAAIICASEIAQAEIADSYKAAVDLVLQFDNEPKAGAAPSEGRRCPPPNPAQPEAAAELAQPEPPEPSGPRRTPSQFIGGLPEELSLSSSE